VGLHLILAAGSLQATTITSADFSVGIGATGTGTAVWTTEENSANNSPAVQGDFTFLPSATSSSEWQIIGPSFANRTLTSGGNSCGFVADPGFGLPIVASYSGPAPADADPLNPNYQLTVEITGLGIYIGDYGAGSTSGCVAQWSETTTGHTQTSPLTDLLFTGVNATNASIYTHVVWDPTDYSVTLAGLNDSVTRSFTIPVSGPQATDYRYADGIEVFGRVSLSYNAVPEPSTSVLVCAGVIGMLAYAWRARR
jgi:hypothetical protein